MDESTIPTVQIGSDRTPSTQGGGDAMKQRSAPPAPGGNEYGSRMAELARSLGSQRTFVSTLEHIVQATSDMLKQCDDVAVSLVHRDGRVETRASLSGLAKQADQLQHALQEGPCIDTAWDDPLVLACRLPEDGHWPRWSQAVADQLGVRSILCVQLFTHEDHELGALQVYSKRADAFDQETVDQVLGIAAHAAVALAAVANLESMQFGLVRRTMIGQATGILMERYQLDAHAAFEVLRRTSQESGRKVYDLAIELVQGQRPSGL